jgi:hypothetical protein
MVDREDAKSTSEQLKFEWIIKVITEIGINLDECLPESGRHDDRTIGQIKKLRDIITEKSLVIQEDGNENTVIYSCGELIGQWNKPKFVLHHDHSIIDRRKQFYTEIQVQHWCFKDEE